MAERKIDKIPARTERYREVMDEAVKRAFARKIANKGTPLVTTTDVFEALCVVHPEAFSQILERAVPLRKIPPAECQVSEKICYSSEVDRYLSPYGGVLDKMLSSFKSVEITVDSLHIAAAFLWEPIPEIENILSVWGVLPGVVKSTVIAYLKRNAVKDMAECRRKELANTFQNVIKIREYLQSRCFGQDEAIDTIITQLAIAWGMTPTDKGTKPLSFFFVGAPGTGKNHLTALLQDAFESILGIPKLSTIDFARFATEQLPIDLIGRDSVWKDGGHEGILTGAAAANPRGIIVIENYERGHACAVSYLDSILETGFAEDAFTKQNVCFSQNIFIVITHKKEFVESEDFLELISKDGENPPRDKIIEGLVKFAPTFQSTLSLTDAPILLRKHTFNSFFAIIKGKLSLLARHFKEAYEARCELESEDIYQLLVEMHPSMDSAHPIVSALESVILIPLQNWLLLHFSEFEARKKIRLECDPIPDFEGAPCRSAFSSFEDWMAARTKRRLLQSKRLVFSHEIQTTEDAVILKFKNISYAVMPNIEDAGYFSVVVPDVSFSELVGVDVVRERVSEVIEYFNNPDSASVRPDTGIVLYGPPGTGKTSVAKAIAKELGVPFIMAMGADFSKQCYGEGIESVKKLFAAARRYGAVVFIDEIDGIGSRNNASPEGARVINAFLTELDGFRERNMLVIGATNRYEDLDEALVRPGRLSLKIQLGLLHRPDDRRKLITGALAKAKAEVRPEIIDQLVETTNSWSPANLVAMVNGGIRFALRNKEEITFAHFAKARTVVMLGEDPQRQEGTAKETHLIAVHEAGHVVIAVLRNIRFVQATVQGVGSTAGFIEHFGMQAFATANDINNMIEMCLGGRVAEELLAEPSDGVQSDFEHATYLAAKMIKLGLAKGNVMAIAGEENKEFTLRYSNEIEEILLERMKSVQKLLWEHRKFLEAVVEALVTQKVLFEADVISIKETLETEA